jgi:hypothetical protein
VTQTEGEPVGRPAQQRVLAYLEGVSPDDVLRAARRFDEYDEARAIALGRIQMARAAAEEANDGEAVEVLISLADMEKAGDGPGDQD